MKTILHIAASPRGAASYSREAGLDIVNALRTRYPDARVITRDLGAHPLPHVDADYANTLTSPQDPAEHIAAAGALGLSHLLIRELADADCLVISTPMHNYTVPSVLKAWIDHVVRVRHTFTITREGKVGLLADRPVYVAVAAGGVYAGERARQPDFLTPYLRKVLETMGLYDITFFDLQGLGGVAPHLMHDARHRTRGRIGIHFAERFPISATSSNTLI
jgi:FMN-dependent NADH-azoreductase